MARAVRATVGVIDGGVAINWGYLGLPKEAFRAFLAELLGAMGFPDPDLVYLERNRGDRVDWNRLRINRQECILHGVEAEKAAHRAAEWLGSGEPRRRYGIHFIVRRAV